MLTLPKVEQSCLRIGEIEWLGLPKRYLNPGEGEVLVALLRGIGAESVLEIGCNDGRTAQLLLHNVPTIRSYQGIDVPPGYDFACPVQKNEIPKIPGQRVAGDARFELFLRPRGSFDLSPEDLRPCDAVFIDGDHGKAAVVHDTELARALVRPGGLIIWHDYHDLGTVDVRDALHYLRDEGMHIEHVAGTWVAFHRVAALAAVA